MKMTSKKLLKKIQEAKDYDLIICDESENYNLHKSRIALELYKEIRGK